MNIVVPATQLGKSGAELGINVQRFGLDFGDLSSPEAIDRAVAVAESAPPGTCGWLSLPCSPWSVLQNLNIAIAEKKGPAVIKALRFRLKRERAKSIVMLNGFARVARVLRAKGGYIAQEWPRHCHGWQDGNVLAYESSLVFSVVLLMPALRVFVAQKPVYRSKSLFALAQIVLRCSQPLPLISQCCVKVNTQNMGKV